MTIVLLLVCLVQSSACYTFHVYQTGGAHEREGGNQPGTEWKHATRHSFAWGLIRQDLSVQNCQLDGQRFGIEEVKVETNYAYILASALTLGLWTPIEISWKCAKPAVPTGVLHGAKP